MEFSWAYLHCYTPTHVMSLEAGGGGVKITDYIPSSSMYLLVVNKVQGCIVFWQTFPVGASVWWHEAA